MADDIPKIIPALAWYRPFEPYAYAFIRFCIGAIIVPHGIDRLVHSGTRSDLGGFLGSLPVSAVGIFEIVAGVMLALGLLTRPVALLLGIEWLLIAFAIPLKPGTNWLLLGATPHYAAFVAVLCFALIPRGGGAYSLDRKIGREI
jgi:putative oxidoreductase